jgi:hypothetical protein
MIEVACSTELVVEEAGTQGCAQSAESRAGTTYNLSILRKFVTIINQGIHTKAQHPTTPPNNTQQTHSIKTTNLMCK